MQVTIENFGPIKYAKYSINDLTIIFGANNMGKTYATYAFYGFVDYWNSGVHFPIDHKYISDLFTNQYVSIPLTQFCDNYNKILEHVSRSYSNSKVLAQVFGAPSRKFDNASFKLSITDLHCPDKYTCSFMRNKDNFITAKLEDGELKISLKKK